MGQVKMATTVNPLATVKIAHSWISHHRAEDVLYYTHFAYPIVLFILFVALFAAHGILTASTDYTRSAPLTITGPGGKPLPNTPPPRTKRPKKPVFNNGKRIVFKCFHIGLIFTFGGNATIVCLRALANRGWWCGEATAASKWNVTSG
jgi:ATP-binding cassette, subfamily B, vacuolar membrane transporter HMT1/ACLQ